MRDLIKLMIFTYDKISDDKLSILINPKEISKAIYSPQPSKHAPTGYTKRYQSDDLSAITESDNESNLSIYSHDHTPHNESAWSSNQFEKEKESFKKEEKSLKKEEKINNKQNKSFKEIKAVFEYITLKDFLKLFFGNY